MTALARRSAERAVALNSGDWGSWTNLSLLCLADGDEACAANAAQQSAKSSGGIGLALVNAADVFEALDRPVEADDLYRRALLTNWETSLTVDWPRTVALVGPPGIASGTFDHQLALLVARRHRGEDLLPDAYALASVRALAFAMDGNRAAAHRNLAAAYEEQPADPVTWDVAALLQAHWGEDDAPALRLGTVTRGWPLATQPPGIPPLSSDIGSFRSYPGDALIGTAQRLLPTQPWPWSLEPLLAP